MATRIPYLAGWASLEITPDIPCPMGGYGARSGPANATHDPLYVHALALGTEAQQAVLLLCDLVAVDEMLVHQVRAQVATRFPGVTTWIGATHTHSGPNVARSLSLTSEPPDPAVRQRIIAQACNAAESALSRMHPVWPKWTSGVITGIATNRDHPDESTELPLDMLCLYDTDEPLAQLAALLASFPCHPTVMGADNLAISADLPGAYRRQLHTLLGGNTWIALATGAAGDISTRHMRRAQSFDELERLGGLLAQQAYALLSTAQPLRLASPRVDATVVELAAQEPLPPDELSTYTRSVQEHMRAQLQAGNMAQARTLETVLQGLQATQRRSQAPGELAAQRVEVSIATLGELALVAIPGELYRTLGIQIQRGSEHSVLLLGYTNGYAGYLPTRSAYAALDYEVLMSPFAPGSGELLVNEVVSLLRQE